MRDGVHVLMPGDPDGGLRLGERGDQVWVVAVRERRCVGYLLAEDSDGDDVPDLIFFVHVNPEWRRMGIGSKLAQEALRRFPITRLALPLSEQGRRLTVRLRPELLKHLTSV